jgi:carbon monoxide dehydrogenase subunit G
MATFTVTTFINRPPQEVFDFATNPANSAKWQSGTESAEWSSEGPVGVGSTVHSVGRLLGRELDTEAEITQWDPPNLWGLKVDSGPLKFEGINRFESKDGGTLLIQEFQGEVGGFFKIAEGLAIKQAQKQVETDGNALKLLLEAD